MSISLANLLSSLRRAFETNRGGAAMRAATNPVRISLSLVSFVTSLALAFGFLLVAEPARASSQDFEVATFAEFEAALGAAVNGDSISFTADIIATKRLSTAKSLTINGNGFLWSVERPGLSDAGLAATSTSAFGLFQIQSPATVVIDSVTIIGGSSQRVIDIRSGATLRLSNSSIERASAGAIENSGSAYLERVRIRRNAASWGGGFLNRGGANMVVVDSTFSENRSTSVSGGGGAGENQGTLWIVTSTFANNFSTEIGSAINNYQGTVYVAHSTFVGNVGSSSYRCGALGVNGGSARVISSLFAYNYEVSSSGNFILMDVGNIAGSWCVNANVQAHYSMMQSADQAWLNGKGSGNATYGASADGQTGETLFSGGALVRPTRGDGLQLTSPSTTVFRPNLVVESGVPIAALREQNSTPNLSSATPIYFEAKGAQSVLAYWHNNQWVVLSGTLPAGVTDATHAQPTVDQVGVNFRRPAAAVGATELQFPETFTLIAKAGSNGDVAGASIFGDSYLRDTSVEVVAIPKPSFVFEKWIVTKEPAVDLQVSSAVGDFGVFSAPQPQVSESTSNPLTIVVESNTTLEPVFASAAADSISVSYASNGATSGAAPPAQTFTKDSVQLAATNSGNLQRTGYLFSGWNTASNGAGTTYAAGDQIPTSTNLILYARWVQAPQVTISFDGNSSDTGTPPPQLIVSAGSLVSLPANIGQLSKEGHVFAGWNTSADESGTFYVGGSQAIFANSATLFAVWEPIAPEPQVTIPPVILVPPSQPTQPDDGPAERDEEIKSPTDALPTENLADKLSVESSRRQITIYTSDIENRRLSVKIGGRWIVVPEVPEGPSYALTTSTISGRDVTILLYVDRKLISSISITTR